MPIEVPKKYYSVRGKSVLVWFMYEMMPEACHDSGHCKGQTVYIFFVSSIIYTYTIQDSTCRDWCPRVLFLIHKGVVCISIWWTKLKQLFKFWTYNIKLASWLGVFSFNGYMATNS